MDLPRTEQAPAAVAARFSRADRLLWPLLAVAAAVIPVGGVFSFHRVFAVRDLGLFFWSRQLWLRRSLLSGEWPLWDPYLSAGQSAVADAMHQMFLLPVLALRLLGTEVVGYNLWIAVPVPFAALGAYLFLRRRFSAPASALGAIAFAVSGPVASSANFPNFSWSVAAMPWLIWAVDRCLVEPSRRAVALLALVFAFQILAGEPVTMTATAVVALGHAAFNGLPDGNSATERRLRRLVAVGAGLALGALLSAVQLIPLFTAASGSWRTAAVGHDSWSLHPLALTEMLSPHLAGDYFQNSSYLTMPWITVLNSGRDPFFFSLYFGTTVLALALFGLVAGWRRTWSAFWLAALVASLFCAFGPYTPIYPFIRDHAPLIGSFRFPVKYLLVAVLALSALVAAGWDALVGEERRAAAPRRYRWAQRMAVAAALAVAVSAYLLSFLSLYFPVAAARQFFDLAGAVGVLDPVAGAEFLLKALPAAASRLVLLSLGAALFLGVASTRRKEARLARVALFLLLAVDLVVSNWGLNPTIDVALFQAPSWIGKVQGHPETSFYFGGKTNGTLDWQEVDGAKTFVRPFGLSFVEGRSALSHEAAFFPAVYGTREIFSYDLPTLWPRRYEVVHQRFLQANQERREHFLANMGVRFRLLVDGRAGGRKPIAGPRYLEGLHLYDWGPTVTPRAAIVPEALLIRDLRQQIDGLFDPAFDARRLVLLGKEPPQPAGVTGSPAQPSARVSGESTGRVDIEAAVPATGGFLVLLDGYSPDWQATVDGAAAPVLQANALYRAVRLAPGRHRVQFRYRPVAFYQGAAISSLALLLIAWLALSRVRPVPVSPL